MKMFSERRSFLTLWFLQYSASLQCDSLRGEICWMSARYLIAEQEEVNTIFLTVVAFAHDFRTFRVPFILGSIKLACKKTYSSSHRSI